jgi:hypothetical protein
MSTPKKYTIEDMKKLAQKRDGKCLSKNYVNAITKLKWQCSKKHLWEASPISIRRGSWCLECSGSKKKNIKNMQTLAKQRGGKCLSNKYLSNKTKLKWKCIRGHVWEAVPSSILSGTWCPICARGRLNQSRKLTISEMQTISKKRGGKCLSKEYINANIKLKWQCGEGHIWEAKPSHIKSGSWCPYCAGKHLTIDEIRRIAQERGGECISNKYIDSRTKLRWRCSKGHIWESNPHNIITGTWCPECGGSKKLDIEEMKMVAKRRGGECLSQEYINARNKLKWLCKEGHIWKATPCAIKRGSWCPECSIGLEERICREFFEQLFKKKFPKSRPKWLVNPENYQMELDGYCKKLGLAFEHQGIQHYNRVEYLQSKQQFIKRKRDDREKERLCKEHGVILIKIPEIQRRIKLTEVKDFIIKECKNAGFRRLPKNIERVKVDLEKAYTPDSVRQLEIIKKIAIKQGGKCLSEYYIGSQVKMTFQCKKGHIWQAIPDSIKRRNWCPICANKKRAEKRKFPIEMIQALAKNRRGECLSRVYINSKEKLKWKCNKGHIWEAPLSSIRQGQWCPYCAGNKKLTLKEFQIIAKERGGYCLSNKYINAKTKLGWKCKEGHTLTPSPLSRQKMGVHLVHSLTSLP